MQDPRADEYMHRAAFPYFEPPSQWLTKLLVPLLKLQPRAVKFKGFSYV